MGRQKDAQPPVSRTLRVFVAILIGLLGSLIIWVATPYNNFLIDAGFISDSYLPIGALFLMLLLVMVVNPLLLKLAHRWSLDYRQLALIMGMLLMASVIPGQGLLRMLPYGLARTNWHLTQQESLSSAFQQAETPDELFPDSTKFGDPAPASYTFLQELPADESIPWSAWLGPLASWGGLMLFVFIMMMGLSMIVLPQWQRNERLAFPLLELERSLIEQSDSGHILGPLFRRRSFWIGAALVFVIQLLYGLNIYFPSGVPAIPLQWNLNDVFTEEPLVYLHHTIKSGQIYFLLIGVTFFMPTRISFSIWFFQLAYAAYAVIRQAYLPPWHQDTVVDHRTGAMIALSIGIIWLGRRHWYEIIRCMISRPASDEHRYNRVSGLTFLLGLGGMFAWLVWVNVQPLVALGFVTIAFMVSLLISRIVAETGLPFVRIDSAHATQLMRLLPVGWFTAASVFFSGIMVSLFQFGSRVNAAAMGTHAIALDPDANPRARARMAWLFVLVMMIGVVICGAVHLGMNYNHSISFAGDAPLNSGGTTQFAGAEQMLREWDKGAFNEKPYNQPAHIAFGLALAGALQWAAMNLPKWPLHPVGLLLVFTFYSNTMWLSVLLGWSLKSLILRFGGAGLYRRAIPLFMGLIVGEIVATALWSIVPAMMIFMGVAPQDLQKVLVQPT